jgi:Domain of unknown function (DUF5916)
MKYRFKCLNFLFFLGISNLIGQITNDANRKTLTATRTNTPPKLDGDLNDECWKNAPIATDFISNSPVFGKPATEKTEVRVVYTDEAIYVGAYMYQSKGKIRTDLSKRDAETNADRFALGFDTYLDRQNGFRFEISASGVQRDIRMSPEDFDPNWDAVWDAKVKVLADAWVAEIKIPFSAIRFAKSEEQTWGLQFARQIQSANELSTWSPVDPTGPGIVPQWGNLVGLKDLNPPLRLSFSPYFAGSVQHSPLGDKKSDGFSNGRTISGGADVKWGINEGFTLDATLIPNFGEVQSDNKVRNLSPFEVQYEERRQFFTEGTELFSKGNLFYSRRIGGTPNGIDAAVDAVNMGELLIKNPPQQQLYNATKLSGRTKSKLGIGILNAVAAPSFALIQNETTKDVRKFQTSELSNYNVLVLDQILPHNSSVSFTNTSVLRNSIARDANVSALVFDLLDKSTTYFVYGSQKMSQIFNENAKKRGFAFDYRAGKSSGSWTWSGGVERLTKNYNQQDLGFFRRNNFINYTFQTGYSNYKERKNILNYEWNLNVENDFLDNPRLWEAFEIGTSTEITTKKRRQFSLEIFTRPLWYWDYNEPRIAGKKFHHAPFGYASGSISTDRRKKVFTSFGLSFGESPLPNDPYLGFNISPTWVANNHNIFKANIEVFKDFSNYGAVNWDNPNDIIFGRRNITSFDNELSLEHLFSPRMSATMRVRHYWSKLYYGQYYHLQVDGTLLDAPDFTSQRFDENFNLFNVDFVFSWQIAPGSFLNVIWKDAIFQYDNERFKNDPYFRNLRRTTAAPQDNSLAVKLIYYLDYLKLR